MQLNVFKVMIKISLLFNILFFTLVNTSTVLIKSAHAKTEKTKHEVAKPNPLDKLKLAALLPMSGQYKNLSNLAINAMILAIQTWHSAITINFYDTKGTPEGAKNALNRAIYDKNSFVIGPLFSQNTQAISNILYKKNIIAISYSSDPDVVGYNVYTSGLLLKDQVDAIVKFAKKNGRKKFAAILENTDANKQLLKIYKNSIYYAGAGSLVKYKFFDNRAELANMVRELANFNERNAKLLKKIKTLKKELYELDDPIEIKKYEEQIKEMSQLDTIEPPPFDVLLINSNKNILKELSATILYNDINFDNTQISGLITWHSLNDKIKQLLSGSYVVNINRNNFNLFAQQYYDQFNVKPNLLIGMIYDTTSLLCAFANRLKDLSKINPAILQRAAGFKGVTGNFKFNDDGTNTRKLEIHSIDGTKIQDQINNIR